jgi:hypothetical protein
MYQKHLISGEAYKKGAVRIFDLSLFLFLFLFVLDWATKTRRGVDDQAPPRMSSGVT